MLAQGIDKVATLPIPPEIDKLATLSIPREIDKVATSSMPKDVTVLKGPRTRTLGCTISLRDRLHLRCDGDFLRCRSRE